MSELSQAELKQQNNKATFVWIALMFATAIGAFLGSLKTTGVAVVLLSIVVLVVKGQLIVDYFMGLKPVARHWRILMSAYSIVIGAFVFLAYCLSLTSSL